MYPILFEIPSFQLFSYVVPGFEISTFGILVALGALFGGRLFAIALGEVGYHRECAWSILFWALLGGIGGAKLWYVAEMVARTSSDQFFEFLTSRGGLTWYGGLVGGGLAVLLAARANQVPLKLATHFAAPAVAAGQCLGRIGCFFVGDDYGVPTDLPWGVAFPKGLPPTDVPVHPTMLYEAAWLALIAWILWKRRATSSYLFAEYLVLAGVGRFLDEFLRANPAWIAGLTNAQITAVVCILIGGGLMAYFRSQSPSLHSQQPAPESS